MTDIMRQPASSRFRGLRQSRFWQKFTRRKSALVGLGFVLFVILVAMLAPVLATHDPAAQSWSEVRAAPSLGHFLGTDELGRDLFSRLAWGARASLLAGVTSVAIAMMLGVPLGLWAGMAGGFVDGLISRFADAMLACPFLILAIAFAAFLGPSLTNAMLAIGITAMPLFIRLTRGQVLSIRSEEYIDAARVVGNPTWRIALWHVLPNIMPQLLVQATLTVAMAIIAEASLSFLGLGQQPPAPSWGSMLNSAQRFMTQAPWMALWPGLSIFLTVLSFNLLGDGLRDALDPRER